MQPTSPLVLACLGALLLCGGFIGGARHQQQQQQQQQQQKRGDQQQRGPSTLVYHDGRATVLTADGDTIVGEGQMGVDDSMSLPECKPGTVGGSADDDAPVCCLYKVREGDTCTSLGGLNGQGAPSGKWISPQVLGGDEQLHKWPNFVTVTPPQITNPNATGLKCSNHGTQPWFQKGTKVRVCQRVVQGYIGTSGCHFDPGHDPKSYPPQTPLLPDGTTVQQSLGCPPSKGFTITPHVDDLPDSYNVLALFPAADWLEEADKKKGWFAHGARAAQRPRVLTVRCCVWAGGQSEDACAHGAQAARGGGGGG